MSTVTRGLRNATGSELSKLLTLPAAIAAACASVLIGGAISGALAAGGQGERPAAIDAVLATISFVQVCFIVLGVLPTTHEHDGGQLRTSLAATPGRGMFFAGKSAAAVIALGLTALAAVSASLAAAMLVQRLSGVAAAPAGASHWQLAGAAAYLVLIGLLSHAIATIARRLTPALVSALVVVFIVPPLLAVSEHARWLPTRAGGLLYTAGSDGALTAGTGALVLAGWILAAGAAAFLALRARDA